MRDIMHAWVCLPVQACVGLCVSWGFFGTGEGWLTQADLYGPPPAELVLVFIAVYQTDRQREMERERDTEN